MTVGSVVNSVDPNHSVMSAVALHYLPGPVSPNARVNTVIFLFFPEFHANHQSI